MYVSAVYNASGSEAYVVIDGVAEAATDPSGVGALDLSSSNFGILSRSGGGYVTGKCAHPRLFKSTRTLAQLDIAAGSNKLVGGESAFYRGKLNDGATAILDDTGLAPAAVLGTGGAAPDVTTIGVKVSVTDGPQ
jgi:hypothetical protein